MAIYEDIFEAPGSYAEELQHGMHGFRYVVCKDIG